MTRRLASAVLLTSGLPRLEPVLPGDDRRFDAAAAALLDGGDPQPDIPRLTLIRWVAQRRGLLFHGSGRDDLTTLEPIRLTRDSTPFGDQQAVFASSDPVWAIYFATLRRGNGFRSTRNGSMGVLAKLYPRWYFFSHNEGAEAESRFGDGWLYVFSRAGFQPEPPSWGIDYAHWASRTGVTPIARLAVSACDFPFADRVTTHRPEQSMVTTVLRASRFGRLYRSSRKADTRRSTSSSSL